MITVHVRKQGGAAIMTIPANVLKILNIQVGSALELDITNEGFIAHPARSTSRKRYTLGELLRGATPENLKILHKKTTWARKGSAVGRELS